MQSQLVNEVPVPQSTDLKTKKTTNLISLEPESKESETLQNSPVSPEVTQNGNDSLTMNVIEEQVSNTVRKQFISKFGREPTEEELKSFSENILTSFFEKFGSVDGTETEDPTYNPNEEEEVEEVESEIEEVLNSEMKTESNDNSEEFSREFESALRHIRRLAVKDSEFVLQKAKQNYFEETGEECDEETLANGFRLLKMKIFEETEDVLSDISEEAELELEEQELGYQSEEAYEQILEDLELLEEECEDETQLSESDIRREVAEAMENVRQCGRNDGKALAEMISSTFYEINGREADSYELNDVFSRLQERVVSEVTEDFSSITKTIEENELVSVLNNLPENNEETVELLQELEDSELLTLGKCTVTQDIATEAKDKFVSLIGREPSLEEFNELLIQLTTTRFTGENVNYNNYSGYSSDESSDSDYNPRDMKEVDQERADIIEDTIDESFEIDLQDCFGVLNNKSYNLETSTNSNSKYVPKKPVAFFSPVRTNKTKKSSFTSVSSKFVERGIKHFVAIHNREPTEEEIQHFKSFISIGDLPIEEEESLVNEITFNSVNLEENYRSEEDSSYNPSNDETCNVNEDYEEIAEEELKAELENEKKNETEEELTIID